MCQYPTIDLKATGVNIKKLREECNLSVKDLQIYFGFREPQAIYKWQQGKSLPSVDNLLALSLLLGTTMEGILIRNDEMPSRLFPISITITDTDLPYAS